MGVFSAMAFGVAAFAVIMAVLTFYGARVRGLSGRRLEVWVARTAFILVLALLLGLALALVRPAGAQDVDPVDRFADRAAGEARVVGPDGVALVACTMRARLAVLGDPDRVLAAYNAPDVPATPVERDTVARVMAGLEPCPDGAWFALSTWDVYRLRDRGILHGRPLAVACRRPGSSWCAHVFPRGAWRSGDR